MPETYRPGYGRPGPLTPIAGPNQNILVHRENSWFKYRVTGVEAIPSSQGMVLDIGAINAAATTTDQTLQTPLDLGNFELGQARLRTLDDVRVTVNQPRQTGKFTAKRVQSTVSLPGRINDPCGHLSEFYWFKDEYPFVDVLNPTDYNILLARLVFWGFRYKIEELSQHPLITLKDIPGPYVAVMGEALLRGGGEG